MIPAFPTDERPLQDVQSRPADLPVDIDRWALLPSACPWWCATATGAASIPWLR